LRLGQLRLDAQLLKKRGFLCGIGSHLFLDVDIIHLTQMSEILENAVLLEWELGIWLFLLFFHVILFITLVLLLLLSLFGSQAAPVDDRLYYFEDELSETEGYVK
jgi:hypothetical protein